MSLEVFIKKNKKGNWKSVWLQRENNDCFFCPDSIIQTNGAKMISTWSNAEGTDIGKEIRQGEPLSNFFYI